MEKKDFYNSAKSKKKTLNVVPDLPYALRVLKDNGKSWRGFSPELKYYEEILDIHNQKRSILVGETIEHYGRLGEFGKDEHIMIHWTTVVNNYSIPLSSCLTLCSSMKLDEDYAHIDEKYLGEFETNVDPGLKQLAQSLGLKSHMGEIKNGISFEPIRANMILGAEIKSRALVWKIALDDLKIDILSNETMKSDIIRIGADMKKYPVETGIREPKRVDMTMFFEKPLFEKQSVARLTLYEKRFEEFTNAKRQQNQNPNTKLELATTLINTVQTSHSIFQPSLSRAGQRSFYYDIYFRTMIDNQTKNNLIFETLQSSLKLVTKNFKIFCKVEIMPYELVFDMETLKVDVGNFESSIQNADKYEPSQKWISLLTSKFTDNVNASIETLSVNDYSEEFGLTKVISEGSKVLSMSHSFLIRFVGLDWFDMGGSENADGENDKKYEPCFHEEILPFEIKMVPSKRDNSRKAPKCYMTKNGHLETYIGTNLYEKMQNEALITLFRRPEFEVAISLKELVDNLPIQFETTIGGFKRTPKPKNRRYTFEDFTVDHGKCSGAIIESFGKRSNLTKIVTDSVQKNKIIGEEFDDKLVGTLRMLYDKYEKKRKSFTIAMNNTEDHLEKNEMSNVVNEITKRKLEDVELNTLLFVFLKDFCLSWFDLHNNWFVSKEISEVVFTHNNLPLGNKPGFLGSDSDLNEMLNKMKMFGVIGLTSWYTLVLVIYNMNDDLKSSSIDKNYFMTKLKSIWLNTDSNSSDNEVKTAVVEFIHDELSFCYNSILSILISDPREKVKLSSMNTFLKKFMSKRDNSKYEDSNSERPNEDRILDEWLLAVDGFSRVDPEDNVVASLYSESTMTSRYEGKKIQNLAMTIDDHKKGRNGALFRHVLTNGGLFIKHCRTLEKKKEVGVPMRHLSIGSALKLSDIVNGSDYAKFESWAPFSVTVPKGIYCNRTHLDEKYGSSLKKEDNNNVHEEIKFDFKTPHEFSFSIGEKISEMREDSKCSVVNGYVSSIEVNHFPLKGSVLVLDGLEFLRIFCRRLQNAEGQFYQKMLNRRTGAVSNESSKKLNKSKKGEPVKMWDNEYLQYQQLVRTKYNAKSALACLETEEKYDVSFGDFTKDSSDTVNYGERLPYGYSDSGYSLEWHFGTAYEGDSSFVGRGYYEHVVYATSSDGTPNLTRGLGEYTLWLVLDHVNDFTKYVGANKVVLPEMSENVDREYEKNVIASLSVSSSSVFPSSSDALITKIKKSIESIETYKEDENCSAILNSLNFYETAIISGKEHETPDLEFSRYAEVQYEHAQKSSTCTMDFNSSPGYLLMKICSVTVKDSNNLKKVSKKSTICGVKQPEDADFVIEVEEYAKLPMLSRGAFLESYVSDRKLWSPESSKYSSLSNKFSIPSKWIDYLALVNNSNSIGTAPKHSNIIARKLMGGDYMISFRPEVVKSSSSVSFVMSDKIKPEYADQSEKYSDEDVILKHDENETRESRQKFDYTSKRFQLFVEMVANQQLMLENTEASNISPTQPKLGRYWYSPLHRYFQPFSILQKTILLSIAANNDLYDTSHQKEAMLYIKSLVERMNGGNPDKNPITKFQTAVMLNVMRDVYNGSFVDSSYENWKKHYESLGFKFARSLSSPVDKLNIHHGVFLHHTNIAKIMFELKTDRDSQTRRNETILVGPLESTILVDLKRKRRHSFDRDTEKIVYRSVNQSIDYFIRHIFFCAYLEAGRGDGSVVDMRKLIFADVEKPFHQFDLSCKVNVICLDSFTNLLYVHSNECNMKRLLANGKDEIDKDDDDNDECEENVLYRTNDGRNKRSKAKGEYSSIPVNKDDSEALVSENLMQSARDSMFMPFMKRNLYELLRGLTEITAHHLVYDAMRNSRFRGFEMKGNGGLVIESVPVMAMVTQLKNMFGMLMYKENEHLKSLEYSNHESYATRKEFGEGYKMITWGDRFLGKNPFVTFKAMMLEKLEEYYSSLSNNIKKSEESGMRFVEDKEDHWAMLFTDYMRISKMESLVKIETAPLHEKMYGSMCVISSKDFMSELYSSCTSVLEGIENIIDSLLHNSDILGKFPPKKSEWGRGVNLLNEEWKFVYRVRNAPPAYGVLFGELFGQVLLKNGNISANVNVLKNTLGLKSLDNSLKEQSRALILENLCRLHLRESSAVGALGVSLDGSLSMNASKINSNDFIKLVCKWGDLDSEYKHFTSPTYLSNYVSSVLTQFEISIGDHSFTKYDLVQLCRSIMENKGRRGENNVKVRLVDDSLIFIGDRSGSSYHHFDTSPMGKMMAGGTESQYRFREWIKTFFIPNVFESLLVKKYEMQQLSSFGGGMSPKAEVVMSTYHFNSLQSKWMEKVENI